MCILSKRAQKSTNMKKYLLLIEDEALWERFKSSINKDINTEIMELIKEKDKKEKKDAKK